MSLGVVPTSNVQSYHSSPGNNLDGPFSPDQTQGMTFMNGKESTKMLTAFDAVSGNVHVDFMDSVGMIFPMSSDSDHMLPVYDSGMFAGSDPPKLSLNLERPSPVPTNSAPVFSPPTSSGKGSSNAQGAAPVEVSAKKRKRFTQFQLESLEKSFSMTKNPSITMREELARSLDMTAGQVKIWFQNRRQKEKRNLKDSMKDGNGNFSSLTSPPQSPITPHSMPSTPSAAFGLTSPNTSVLPVSPTIAGLTKLQLNSPTRPGFQMESALPGNTSPPNLDGLSSLPPSDEVPTLPTAMDFLDDTDSGLPCLSGTSDITIGSTSSQSVAPLQTSSSKKKVSKSPKSSGKNGKKMVINTNASSGSKVKTSSGETSPKSKSKSANLSATYLAAAVSNWVSLLCKRAWSALHVHYYRQGDRNFETLVIECAMVMLNQLSRLERAYSLEVTSLEDLDIDDDFLCRLMPCEVHYERTAEDFATTAAVGEYGLVDYLPHFNVEGNMAAHAILDPLDACISVIQTTWPFEDGDMFVQAGCTLLKKMFQMYEHAIVQASLHLGHDELERRVHRGLDLDSKGFMSFVKYDCSKNFVRIAFDYRKVHFVENPTLEHYIRLKGLCEESELDTLRSELLEKLEKDVESNLETICRILIHDKMFETAMKLVCNRPSSPVVRYVYLSTLPHLDPAKVLQRATQEVLNTLPEWSMSLNYRLFPEGPASLSQFNSNPRDFERQIVASFGNPIAARSPVLRGEQDGNTTEYDIYLADPATHLVDDFSTHPPRFFRGICGWIEVAMVAAHFLDNCNVPHRESGESLISSVRLAIDLETSRSYQQFLSKLCSSVNEAIQRIDEERNSSMGAFITFMGDNGSLDYLGSCEFGGLIRFCNSCLRGKLLEYTRTDMVGCASIIGVAKKFNLED